MQQVGVNGFSYGDLAAELGIKSPSIHHHFPRKDDLMAAVTAEYRRDFNAAVAELNQGNAVADLWSYAMLFATTAATDRMCLCGAVSADWLAVGEATRSEVTGFFDDQIRWLSAQLGRGASAGEFPADLDTEAAAGLLLAALEGSTLLARAGLRAAVSAAGSGPKQAVGDSPVMAVFETQLQLLTAGA